MRHSQALEEAGYDARTRVLRVRFRDGRRGYDYLDVAPEVFEGLLASPHPGRSGVPGSGATASGASEAPASRVSVARGARR